METVNFTKGKGSGIIIDRTDKHLCGLIVYPPNPADYLGMLDTRVFGWDEFNQEREFCPAIEQVVLTANEAATIAWTLIGADPIAMLEAEAELTATEEPGN